MTRIRVTLIAAAVLFGCSVAAASATRPPRENAFAYPLSYDPIAYVDPFIGTGGIGWGMGAMTPGVMLPNGTVKLGPDTSTGPATLEFQHAGGYYHPDTHIRGFSHLHLPGTGITDLGNINLMPVRGISNAKTRPCGYSSPFRHATETARPGYYAVALDRPRVRVELTATMQAGFHRYTFAGGDADPYLIIDVGYSLNRGAARDGNVRIDAASGEVYGSIVQRGGFSETYGGMPIHFVVRFSEPLTDFGLFRDGRRHPRATEIRGDRIGAYVSFAAGARVVLAKVGISLISVEQARRNLDAQLPDWDFAAVCSAAEGIWRDYLSDVWVQGGSESQRRLFYTALYHLYVLPTSLTENGAAYQGFDRRARPAAHFTYYSDFSLWDTFRSYHPLILLLRPKLARDFLLSLMAMNEQGGSYPLWAQGLGDTEVMIGTHADSVFADAVVKKLGGFDVANAYEGLRRHAVGEVPYGGRPKIADWLSLGYVAYDGRAIRRGDFQEQSVARTLEYAYNDFCLAQIARAIGRADDHRLFRQRSRNYRNLWDPRTRFFRAKHRGGRFLRGFDPNAFVFRGYTEGNAHHWRWFVPHDVPGLIELFGGPDAFVAELERFVGRGSLNPDSPAHNPYYWQGNEPDIHAPYLFSLAGRPDRAAFWVRWLCENRFRVAPDGLPGNDDGGSLSSWYIFSALGFYPFAGTDLYAVGAPMFARALVRVGDKHLLVVAKNLSEKNVYVQGVRLNDRDLPTAWFRHDAIADGGTLEFTMGPHPGHWGQQALREMVAD